MEVYYTLFQSAVVESEEFCFHIEVNTRRKGKEAEDENPNEQ